MGTVKIAYIDPNNESFKAGSYHEINEYSYFLPSHINRSFRWDDPTINHLLEKAALKLGELNSLSQLVPDVDMFIMTHIIKEATTSSRIEGTQTNIKDAFLFKSDIEPDKRDDWQENQKYIKAINFSLKSLKQIPISNRLICEAHKRLLSGARGESRRPGEFRTSQNWIGGHSLKDAVFIPPVHTELPELLKDLELFLHNDKIQIPHLIKIAIAHYQFETIHPFLDGNGRVGRLLITIYLIWSKILDKPLLYLSEFFEKNKTLYYDKLTAIRTRNEWSLWIIFFLEGIINISTNSTETLKNIIALKEAIEKDRLATMGRRSKHAYGLLHQLFRKPAMNIKDIQKVTGLTAKAANDLVRAFVEKKILVESTGRHRNRVFAFEEYLNFFES